MYSFPLLSPVYSCTDTPRLTSAIVLPNNRTSDLSRRSAHQREALHRLYSEYCQNKPASEDLRRQIGDTNSFFVECQRRLQHKLPLGAFLLKPVQRITKYQLLLKVRQVIGEGRDRGCQRRGFKEADLVQLGHIETFLTKYLNWQLVQGIELVYASGG